MPSPIRLWPNGANHGLAVVVRKRSEMAFAWEQYYRGQFEGKSELPIGTLVVCLPPEVANHYWTDVVAAINGSIFCTAMATCCLRAIGATSSPVLTVGCVVGRDRQAPTHLELCGAEHKSGVLEQHATGGGFGLDARWPERAPREGRCTGYCLHVASENLQFPSRFLDLMLLAQTAYTGNANCWIACNHATHRSLGAAVFLKLFCHLDLDLRYASPRRRCDCNCPASLPGLTMAARKLPAAPATYSLEAMVSRQAKDGGLRRWPVRRLANDGQVYTFEEFVFWYGEEHAEYKWWRAQELMFM